MAEWKFIQGKITKKEWVELVKQCAEKDIERRNAVREAVKIWLNRKTKLK